MERISNDAIRDIVEASIRNHPNDCIFRVDTVQFVIDWVEHQYNLYKDWPEISDRKEFYIMEIAMALGQCEIYCPHEGIDKRDKLP